jgi:hypothetical protein
MKRSFLRSPLLIAVFAAAAAISFAQATSYGCLDVPPEYTHTAWAAKEGLEGLKRLKDGPFTPAIWFPRAS